MTDTEQTTTKKRSKSGSEKRERQEGIRLRVNEAEKADIQARAEKAGLSVSGYLRAVAFGSDTHQPRAARRPPAEKATLAKLLGELGKIGSNLNQIAHRLNQGRDLEPAFLNEICAELRETNRALLDALGKEPRKPKSGLADKLFKRGGKAP
jgi:hypothetical protein